jgi:prevent-host-death family protein
MIGTKKRLPRILKVSRAKRNFGQILERVHGGKERFVVHGRGYAGAIVIMSVEEYLSEFAEARAQFKELRRKAKTSGLKGWTELDINREIRAYRRLSKRQSGALNS